MPRVAARRGVDKTRENVGPASRYRNGGAASSRSKTARSSRIGIRPAYRKTLAQPAPTKREEKETHSDTNDSDRDEVQNRGAADSDHGSERDAGIGSARECDSPALDVTGRKNDCYPFDRLDRTCGERGRCDRQRCRGYGVAGLASNFSIVTGNARTRTPVA